MEFYIKINEEEAKDLIDYVGFSSNDSAKALVDKVERALAEKGETIHLVWSYEDVIARAKDVGCKIPSKKRAIEIINEINHRHDCNLGVTWETIDCYLEQED